MRLCKALLLLAAGLAGFGNITLVLADPPVQLSPDLVQNWGHILIDLQQGPAAADTFVWRGPLPGTGQTNATDLLASTGQPGTWLELLDTNSVAATDAAVWLLADSAATSDLLLRLSAREWAVGRAERNLAGLLGRLPQGQPAPRVPILFAEPPSPAQRPRLPLVTEPVSQGTQTAP